MVSPTQWVSDEREDGVPLLLTSGGLDGLKGPGKVKLEECQ